MQLPTLYSPEQAAHFLAISTEELEHLLQCGQLHGAHFCGRWRFTQRDLDLFLQRSGSHGLDTKRPAPRRWFALACFASLFVAAFVVAAQGDKLALYARQAFDLPIEQMPPLDSPVVWHRRNLTHSGTVEIVSLLMENKAPTSYPWPLYIQLTSSHDKGDAVGAYVRLRDTGQGWGAAFHTDLYHDGSGTSIGGNFEVTKSTTNGRALGLNIQSKGKTTDEAINLQSDPESRWKTGLHFDQGSKGDRAIWIEGDYNVGLDTGKNDIRLGQGAKLIFDQTNQLYLSYNPTKNRLEFHNGNKVIGFLTTDANEHPL